MLTGFYSSLCIVTFDNISQYFGRSLLRRISIIFEALVKKQINWRKHVTAFVGLFPHKIIGNLLGSNAVV
jgi:hypothetical protein